MVSTDKLWEESRNASGIAKQSADAATRAADVAEKTLIITQRAYISAKEYRTEAIKDDDTNVIGWKIALVWENTGNTPGIQFEAGVYLQEIEVAHEPEPFGLTNREMSAKATIGAKTPMTSRCRLTLDQAERIRSGKIDVFLCGRAEYRDIFPDTGPHHTSVCMKLSIEDPTFKRVNPFGYNAYQKYNEAT